MSVAASWAQRMLRVWRRVPPPLELCGPSTNERDAAARPGPVDPRAPAAPPRGDRGAQCCVAAADHQHVVLAISIDHARSRFDQPAAQTRYTATVSRVSMVLPAR